MKTTSFLLLVILMFISIGCDGTVESKSRAIKKEPKKVVDKPDISQSFFEEPDLIDDLISPGKKNIKIVLVKPPEIKKQKIEKVKKPKKPKKKKRVKLDKSFEITGMYKENGCIVKIYRKDFIESWLYIFVDCKNNQIKQIVRK